MSCKDCDAYCINAGEEDAVSCEGYIPKPQTNADRIRAMTDEELAEFIYQNGYGSCPNIPVCPQYASGKLPYTGDGCKKCWLDWLKQEAT